mgnify:CR=1 FL=1
MNKTHTLSHLLPVLFGFFIMGFCDVVGVATSYVQQHFALSEASRDSFPRWSSCGSCCWPCRWLSG